MNALIVYLFQVVAASGIFYGYYYVALRNNKFHTYNRLYLLLSTVVSITIPFLQIPIYFSTTEAESSLIYQTYNVLTSDTNEDFSVAIVQPANNWVNTNNLLLVAYVVISFIFLFKISKALLKIRQLLKNNQSEKLSTIDFVNTNEPGTPFSFFSWLFWNRKIDIHSYKGEQIFRHELFHIEQKHSWDKLYLEILTAICWINPFFHLIKKETAVIHEFLADQFAIKENQQWQYAELLLMQSFHTNQPFINPFFHNQIKRRITMMTSSNKPSLQYVRKLMLLPILAIVITLFAFSVNRSNESLIHKQIDKAITVVIDAGHGGDDGGAAANDGTYEKNLVLAIAQKVKSLNENKKINIILTRETDSKPDLPQRIEFVTLHNADLFISLHLNSVRKEDVALTNKSGIEVLISNKNKEGEAANKKLAAFMLNYFSKIHTTTMDILQKQQGIYVLDKATCPAALIELGYLTNEKDLKFVKQDANQGKLAMAILNGITAYASEMKMN